MSDTKETNEELSQDELKDISGGLFAADGTTVGGYLRKKPAGKEKFINIRSDNLKAPSQESSSDFHDAACLDP